MLCGRENVDVASARVMYHTDSLEVWNLTSGGVARTGALDRFLVVGRLLDRRLGGRRLTYRLNGGALGAVAQNPTAEMKQRMAPWTFGIDSIRTTDLQTQNELVLCVDGTATPLARIPFRCEPLAGGPVCDLSERLARAVNIEEVAQVVDGPWRVTEGAGGPVVELGRDGAGYDRVCLFTQPLTDGYRIDATLRVTHFKHPAHNVGLVFKWNDHEVGDGSALPTKWNTGLAYFYSSSPGLRLRVGVGVHIDASGRKVGDHVFDEQVMSHGRRWGGGILSRLPPRRLIVSQLRRNVPYRFVADITAERYTLRVGPADAPAAHVLEAAGPPSLLPTGAAGIIALNAAVVLERFAVEPLPSTTASPRD